MATPGTPARRSVVFALTAILFGAAGCSPSRFRTYWEGDVGDTALVYGSIRVPGVGAPRLVSIYKQFRPMLGWKGLGDPGVYDDGAFVVCDLSPGDNYFAQGFWLGDDMYDLSKAIKPFSLKAGQMLYLGSWRTNNFKGAGLIMNGSYELQPSETPSQVKILKSFLADPKIKGTPWTRRIRAEIARLGG
jgi:hypothetical protein